MTLVVMSPRILTEGVIAVGVFRKGKFVTGCNQLAVATLGCGRSTERAVETTSGFRWVTSAAIGLPNIALALPVGRVYATQVGL